MKNTNYETHAGFLTALLNGISHKMTGNAAMVELDDQRLAKIVLSYANHKDNWSEVIVTIIDTKNGVIDSMDFSFNDIMVADKNNTHQNAQFKKLAVVSHVGWQWYIDYPTDESLTDFRCAIADYIAFFR